MRGSSRSVFLVGLILESSGHSIERPRRGIAGGGIVYCEFFTDVFKSFGECVGSIDVGCHRVFCSGLRNNALSDAAEETADLYSYVLEMYSYYGYDTTDSETVAQLKDITLDAMVSAKAQEIMEAEMGLDQFTDEELAQFQSDAQATYDETYQSVYDGFDDGETSEDDLKAQTEAELNKYGYTVEALVEQAKAEAAYNKLYEALTKDVTVTDDDVKEEYAATVASDKEAYENDLDGYSLQSMYGERPAYTPEGIRTVKHILVKFTDEDSQKISELEALSEKPDDYDEQYQALIDAAYANIKDKVDEIVDELEKLPEVAAYYSVWNGLRDTLEGYYKNRPRQHNPLSQQKEFRAIKNAIIQEAERLRQQMEQARTASEQKPSQEEEPSSEETSTGASANPTLADENTSSATSHSVRLPSEYLLNSTIRLFHQMGQIFRDNAAPPSNPMGIRIDSKRRKKLMQKRLAMGHKQDDHEQEQGYNLDIR